MTRLIIHNANILSFHNGFENGSNNAIAIDGNRIVAVGNYQDLHSLVSTNTELIDASGKTLMPSFNDSHIHVWKIGNLKTFMLDLREVKSKAEMLQHLSDYITTNSHLHWITARGFNEAVWTDGKLPTKLDLDKVSKDKPIYVIRTCAHIAVCNSKAMELCNITANTVVPEGGLMQLGDDGKPNGIFAENALALIANHIPAYSKDDLKIMVKATQAEFFQYGITAVTDPGVDQLLLETYDEMNQSKKLGFRLNAMPSLTLDETSSFNLPPKVSSDFYNVNIVKFFADGGLSGKTAALKRSYKNSNERGVSRLDPKRYLSFCQQALEKGFGIATHAIGDAAIAEVIQNYSQLTNIFPNAIKRIEHLGLPEQEQLQAMKTNNIACSMQTIFLNELGTNFIKYLDETYLNQCYPVASVLKHDILMALSSDAPVVKSFNPFKGIAAAVTRRSSNGDLIAAQESITVAEALKAYTINAAQISGTPQWGSLETGKLADFIILDQDPLKTTADQIDKIKVLETYIDGQRVWSAKADIS